MSHPFVPSSSFLKSPKKNTVINSATLKSSLMKKAANKKALLPFLSVILLSQQQKATSILKEIKKDIHYIA